MECRRCGNKDINYFYSGSKGYYCRKCIKFSRLLIEEDLNSFNYDVNLGVEEYSFNFKLTKKQEKASSICAKSCEYSDVLLHCVCGAGKTEIVVESISNYLKKGLKVAYAISRREVVIELEKRFKSIFKKAKVISVYGGHHDTLDGDLIVCTCHQLYRYYKTFDLLILDEVDAFPLKGNETLMNISLNSCKGKIIFSSATVDDDLKRILNKRVYKIVRLYTKPNNKPLVVPKVKYLNKELSLFYLFYLLRRMNGQCIIFVSSKRQAYLLYKLFKLFFLCTYVYSDLDDRQKNIDDFRKGKYKYIFSTSVLERGITIPNINVVILNYYSIFDESNLIQMLGRLQRGLNSDLGEGYIISNHRSKQIDNTIKYLKEANAYI